MRSLVSIIVLLVAACSSAKSQLPGDRPALVTRPFRLIPLGTSQHVSANALQDAIFNSLKVDDPHIDTAADGRSILVEPSIEGNRTAIIACESTGWQTRLIDLNGTVEVHSGELLVEYVTPVQQVLGPYPAHPVVRSVTSVATGEAFVIPDGLRYLHISPDGSSWIAMHDYELVAGRVVEGEFKQLMARPTEGSLWQGDYAHVVWIDDDRAVLTVVSNQRVGNRTVRPVNDLLQFDIEQRTAATIDKDSPHTIIAAFTADHRPYLISRTRNSRGHSNLVFVVDDGERLQRSDRPAPWPLPSDTNLIIPSPCGSFVILNHRGSYELMPFGGSKKWEVFAASDIAGRFRWSSSRDTTPIGFVLLPSDDD